jgi:hypothetical protein
MKLSALVRVCWRKGKEIIVLPGHEWIGSVRMTGYNQRGRDNKADFSNFYSAITCK